MIFGFILSLVSLGLSSFSLGFSLGVGIRKKKDKQKEISRKAGENP